MCSTSLFTIFKEQDSSLNAQTAAVRHRGHPAPYSCPSGPGAGGGGAKDRIVGILCCQVGILLRNTRAIALRISLMGLELFPI